MVVLMLNLLFAVCIVIKSEILCLFIMMDTWLSNCQSTALTDSVMKCKKVTCVIPYDEHVSVFISSKGRDAHSMLLTNSQAE
jgi:hypothetical protein